MDRGHFPQLVSQRMSFAHWRRFHLVILSLAHRQEAILRQHAMHQLRSNHRGNCEICSPPWPVKTPLISQSRLQEHLFATQRQVSELLAKGRRLVEIEWQSAPLKPPAN